MLPRIFLFTLLTPTISLAENGIEWQDYSTVLESTNQFVDFEDQSYSGVKKPVDHLLRYAGIAFGESFVGQLVKRGQTNTYLHDFDILRGNPASPLSIAPGAPGHNVSLYKSWELSSVGLYGEGWIGYPSPSSGGEGSVAIFFEQPQKSFGFRVHAAAGVERYKLGQIRIRCFNMDGDELGVLNFDALKWDTLQSIGVVRTSERKDIHGCTLENTDPKGVFYDDFIFDFRTYYSS